MGPMLSPFTLLAGLVTPIYNTENSQFALSEAGDKLAEIENGYECKFDGSVQLGSRKSPQSSELHHIKVDFMGPFTLWYISTSKCCIVGYKKN